MKKIILILVYLVLLTISASATPIEAFGNVTNVVDGGIIDIQDIGRVRLADISYPKMETAEGAQAKDYATQWLQDRRVFLDLDNKTGKDQYDRWVAVVYIANDDGSVNTSRNFNRMLVDSGNACILDFSDNEFSPADWWDGFIPTDKCIESDQESTSNYGFSSPRTLLQSTSTKSSTSSVGSFVGSSKSNKYHYPSCQWAKKISPANEVWFSGSQDARNQGYVPCKVCSPP